MAPTARRPLLTLGAVVLLAASLLWWNGLAGPPDAAPAAPESTPATATSPATPSAPGTSSAPPTAVPPQGSTDPESRNAVYAGRTDGGEVTVAVAVEGRRAAAYLCDGALIETWLDGSVDGNRIVLTGRGSASLTASVSGTTVSGSVSTAAGQSWQFSADLAPPPAGIYEFRAPVDEPATRIGWVVLPDGTQLGIRSAAGGPSPAPELDPVDGSFRLDGADRLATAVSGSDSVVSR